MPEKPLTASDLRQALAEQNRWGNIFVPEFTWGNLRIDAIVIDTNKRWIRGFEIKVSRADFVADDKWGLYSEFCSSLAIVCPAGLIQPEEVPDPFGLCWVTGTSGSRWFRVEWKKRIKRFQRRDAMAWMWTYLRVLETEMPRLQFEIDRLKSLNVAGIDA